MRNQNDKQLKEEKLQLKRKNAVLILVKCLEYQAFQEMDIILSEERNHLTQN